MRECWNLTEDEFGEISSKIISLKFKPEGNLGGRFGKLILASLLIDFTCYATNRDYSDCIIHPVFNPKLQTVTYKYLEIAHVCGWKTAKTLKKYFSHLVNDGFIKVISETKSSVEIQINLDKIELSPKFEKRDYD